MSDTTVPAHMRPERSFQGLILTLQRYWATTAA
jgi:glycyl-tRNA synthetase alpha chain